MATNGMPVMSHPAITLNEPEPRTHDNEQHLATDSHSILIEHKPHDHYPPGEENLSNGVAAAHNHTKLRDFLFASVVVFVPMAGISLILLGLTFYGGVRAQFPGPEIGTTELPVAVEFLPPSNSFYTTVGESSFLAVGSWSSTVAEAVVAPFTLMFSFFVAQSALRKAVQEPTAPSEEIRTILKNPWQGPWLWIKSGLRSSRRTNRHRMQSTHLAGVGLLFAVLLTLLVIAGDQWLHYTTDYGVYRYYSAVERPISASLSPSIGQPDPRSSNYSSFTLSSVCQEGSAVTLPQNISDAPLPCSLIQNGSIYNVADSEKAYLLLLTSVNRTTSDFDPSELYFLESEAERQEATYDQIINHFDPNTNISHSILFYLPSSDENDVDDDKTIDYVATTTSMSTKCNFATQGCRLANVTNSTEQDNSLSYNCSSLFPFQGDLDKTPENNIEAIRGWNTSFYEMVNGTGAQQSVPLQARLNPFTFSAAVDLNSYPFSTFKDFGPDYVSDGYVIDAGSDHIAFAMNCTSTVWDVSFSFVNGNITQFHASQSDPGRAAIIRAPLQAGFGATYLYSQATLSTISTEDLLTLMAHAFNTAGLAGSYGAFVPALNTAQREYEDLTVTSVSKAALIFQVTVCMLYAVLGLIIMIIGLNARRNEEVRRYQAQLLPPVKSEPTDFKGWISKAVSWFGEEADDIESGAAEVKDYVDDDRDGRDADAQQGRAEGNGRETGQNTGQQNLESR